MAMLQIAIFILIAMPTAWCMERDDAPKAMWPKLFQVEFNETTKILFTLKTQGIWWYDADAKLEKVYRQNGQGDRYCGSIHPLAKTPCHHLVNNGTRYLIFPELQSCCICCGESDGCGILSPNWLDDASYKGQVNLQGQEAYKWRKDGLQPNYYYATANEDQIPLALDQVPNDYMWFHPDTFSTEEIDADVFAVPPYCEKRCPLFSACTIARLSRGW